MVNLNETKTKDIPEVRVADTPEPEVLMPPTHAHT